MDSLYLPGLCVLCRKPESVEDEGRPTEEDQSHTSRIPPCTFLWISILELGGASDTSQSSDPQQEP